MSQGVSNQSSFCVWNAKTQMATLGVGLIAVAALITGIVLIALQQQRGLGIGMIATGSTVFLFDILYVFLSCRNSQGTSAEAPRPKGAQKGEFQTIGIFDQMSVGAAMASGNKEKVKPVLQQVLTNWESNQNAKTRWTQEELAKDLGVSSTFVGKVIEEAVKKGALTLPANGQFSKSSIAGILNPLKKEFDL